MKSTIILIVCFFCTGICSSQTTIPDDAYPPDSLSIPTHSEWTKKHYHEKIMEFKKARLSPGDIVFLGNSITEQGGDWGKRLGRTDVKNRGISGDVTDGVLHRLGEIYYVEPEAVFILIGINDLFNQTLTAEYVAKNIINIAKIIREHSSHTKIYVQTILPTTTVSIAEKISTANAILKKNAKRKRYTLLDTHSLFADEKDLMKKEYTKDGVHLNEDGYALWTGFLKRKVHLDK